MPLRKKGLGQGIMVSDFVTPTSRLRAPVSISDDDLIRYGLRREACQSLEFGGDSWWRNEDLMAQTLKFAIPIFELSFPGCQGIFLFDNARNHKSFAPDALRAPMMNLNPGGDAPIMRDGWFRQADGTICAQTMNISPHPSIPEKLWGKPKGIKIVLQERDIWHGGLRLRCKRNKDCDRTRHGGCCARTLMSLQEDFQTQKSFLEEAIEATGHLSLLYPAFHCELNWIEHFWGSSKWYTRKNCKYGIEDLRNRIPIGLEYAERFIWKFWNRTEKIRDAYRNGVGYGAEKQYKSHRRVFST
jgi:hypothetical protein